jgi:hypothetical protein
MYNHASLCKYEFAYHDEDADLTVACLHTIRVFIRNTGTVSAPIPTYLSIQLTLLRTDRVKGACISGSHDVEPGGTRRDCILQDAIAGRCSNGVVLPLRSGEASFVRAAQCKVSMHGMSEWKLTLRPLNVTTICVHSPTHCHTATAKPRTVAAVNCLEESYGGRNAC